MLLLLTDQEIDRGQGLDRGVFAEETVVVIDQGTVEAQMIPLMIRFVCEVIFIYTCNLMSIVFAAAVCQQL
jgi:hypothetical protein